MMSYGYKPSLSEGAIKCPIFQTSTFVFNSAEEGKAFFEVAYGLREKEKSEELGLIYSRLNNPDLQILEERLTLWDNAEEGAVFESGMSAISTCLLEFLKPGDTILFSNPIYGGTDHFINFFLPKMNINVLGFKSGQDYEMITSMIDEQNLGESLAVIFIETPANPTNDVIDIEMCKMVADRYSTKDKKVLLMVDNTYMGPIWQNPIDHGADIVLYSATKFIGGHSDVIAGAALGSKVLMKRVKELRSFLGSMTSPWTSWLLMRSLETLKLRMEQQVKNAEKVAEYLKDHPKIERVFYLGFLKDRDPVQFEIFNRQCLSNGSMVSFDIKGGEKEAFLFLNNLKLIKLAVSLGSTESLAEHPATMTHAGVDPAHREEFHVTEKLVRLSIGIENHEDLINDIKNALEIV